MSRTSHAVRSLVALALAACGGGEEDPGPRARAAPQNLGESLGQLGVDVEETPRVGDDLEPLPSSYTPLGARRTINRYDEVLLFGLNVNEDEAFGPTDTGSPVLDFTVTGGNRVDPELLDGGTPDALWATDGALRRAAAGDFDGDGREETAIVYQTPGETLDLVIREGTPDHSVGERMVVGTQEVDEVFLAAGDLDGDGVDDLVLAEKRGEVMQVSLLINSDGRFRPEGAGLSFEGGDHIVIELGNLDYDAPAELALVINEGREGDSSRARFAVYDDIVAGLTELEAGLLTVALPDEVLTIRGGGIALADVDGDGLDEVVRGGLTAIGRLCNLETYAALEVRDDSVHGLSPLTANKVRFRDRRQPCSSGASHRLSIFPIQGLDLDGDGAEEIHALEWIYEDLLSTDGTLIELATLPQEEWLSRASSGSIVRIHWSTSSWAVGDVNSDGRQDLLYYVQRLGGGGDQSVQAWGLDMVDGWKMLTEVATTFTNRDDLKPQVVPVDLDEDLGSMGLRFSEGSHQLVFTEPVIIAALAAAPCDTSSGQDVSACRTSYGTAMSSMMSQTNGVSVTAGVSVGYKAEGNVGLISGSVEAAVSTKAALRNYRTTAYTLRTAVRRETGPLEDSVIFTSIPYDVYTYEILSHPNPDLVGEELEVRLPREPITIMATVDFYNQRLAPGGLAIDASIFAHTAGDPSTYRSVSEKDRLLRGATGVESSEVDVGQGGGTSTVEISTFESTTTGRSFQVETTLDIKVSAGAFGQSVFGGFSVGVGADRDMSVTRGTETLYSGSVPNIPQGDLSNGYSFGLFAYLYEDAATGMSFEVLDYWVE